jgi:hypothetical protein
MYWNELLNRSKGQWAANPAYAQLTHPTGVFRSGACWMAQRMAGNPNAELRDGTRFARYGLLKYGLSLGAFTCAAVFLFRMHPAWAALSVLAFYLVEVHFLFLFPLLIDGATAPVRKSILHTYRIGLVYTIFTVMPIACYMVLGLLRLRRPLHNWHIGCLAIIIWYKDATGNR